MANVVDFCWTAKVQTENQIWDAKVLKWNSWKIGGGGVLEMVDDNGVQKTLKIGADCCADVGKYAQQKIYF